MYVIMGATGNIGSKLANILLDKGEKLKVIGRSAERLQLFVDHGAVAAVGDVSDVGLLTNKWGHCLTFHILFGSLSVLWPDNYDSRMTAPSIM